MNTFNTASVQATYNVDQYVTDIARDLGLVEGEEPNGSGIVTIGATEEINSGQNLPTVDAGNNSNGLNAQLFAASVGETGETNTDTNGNFNDGDGGDSVTASVRNSSLDDDG